MLDERKCKILQAIIDDYISTAEPVGSRAIARKHNLGISPATIRNEMADLELLGYLKQPHTSAGRIPSPQGYRFYVDCLLSPAKMTEKDVALLNNWYISRVRRIDEVLQETAKMVSRMTKNISLIMAPQVSQCLFKYLQFLPFDQEKVLALIITDTGFIDNKIIDIPQGFNLADLQNIAEKVNNRLTGLPLELIKYSLIKEIRQEIVTEQAVLESIVDIIRLALAEKKKDRVFFGGTTQLLEQPEFKDVERVKTILNMLEKERLLADIFQAKENTGVIVTIGKENKYSGIQDCSVVQAAYCVEGQVVGTVAVLGPTRMEYGKVMAVLDFMHKHLGEIIKRYNS